MRRATIAVLYCLSVIALGQNETDLWAKYREDLKANPRSSVTQFRMGEIYFQAGWFISQQLTPDVAAVGCSARLDCPSFQHAIDEFLPIGQRPD